MFRGVRAAGEVGIVKRTKLGKDDRFQSQKLVLSNVVFLFVLNILFETKKNNDKHAAPADLVPRLSAAIRRKLVLF